HLAKETAAAGKLLVERLAVYPSYTRDLERWIDPALRSAVLRVIDAQGLARTDDWVAGAGSEPPLTIASHPIPLPAAAGRGNHSPSPRLRGEGRGEGQMAA